MKAFLINVLLVAGTYFSPVLANGPEELPLAAKSSSTFSVDQHITLEKTGTYEDSNGDGQYSEGDKVYYTFLVTNTCTGTISEIRIEDPKVNVTGDPISLEPGQSNGTAFSAVYSLTQEDVDAGLLRNEATVTGKLPSGQTVSASDEDIQEIYVKGSIKLTKTGTYEDSDQSGTVNPGDEIIYRFTVKNSCHVTLTNVLIHDPLVEVTGGPITLAPGQKDKTTFKATYVITQEDILKGKVVNTATAIGQNPRGEDIEDCDTYTVKLREPNEEPLVCLKKSVNVDQVEVGEPFDYTITLTSHADFDLVNLSLEDVLPEELMLISSSWPEDEALAWELELLEAGASVQLQLTVMGVGAGEARNVAKLVIGEYCLHAEADVVVIVPAKVDLAITKTSHGIRIFEGDAFDYTLTGENKGETTATEVVVEDLLPSGLEFLGVSYEENDALEIKQRLSGNVLKVTIAKMEPGQQVEIYVKVKALQIGTIINKATVHSCGDDLDPSDNEAFDENEIKEFFVPNVFTPSARDGKNDTFVIRGINQFLKTELVIMNRWGDHIYEKEGYQNDWDAKGLGAGAYFYVLKALDQQGVQHTFKGWVQVIKDNQSYTNN